MQNEIELNFGEARRMGRAFDKGFLESIAGDLLRLPEKLRKETVRGLARDNQEAVLPLLEHLSESADATLSAAGVEGLGLVSNRDAANVLTRIVAENPDKDLRKEAKRSLFRLKNLGILPEKLPDKVEKAFALLPRLRLAKSYVTSIDGVGSRAIWLAIEKAIQGMVVLVGVINDQIGLKRAVAHEMNKKSLQEELDRMQGEEGLTLIEIPPDYAQRLMKQAYEKSQEVGTAVPAEFLLFKDALVPSSGVQSDKPDIYREIDVSELEASPELPFLLGRSPLLLREKDFGSWLFEFDLVKSFALDYLEAHESKILISSQTRESRLSTIIDRAVAELCDRPTVVLYRQRLDEMAYILLHTARADKARVALAAALQMGQDSPPEDHPFFRALVQKSVAVAIDSHLGGKVPEELALAIMDGEKKQPKAEKRSPGGLILP